MSHLISVLMMRLGSFFLTLQNKIKNMNFMPFQSDNYNHAYHEIKDLMGQVEKNEESNQMKIVYDKINNMRGNLITVTAKDVGLGELARIDMQDGRNVLASVLRIEGDQVTLQVFQSTRGISTTIKSRF